MKISDKMKKNIIGIIFIILFFIFNKIIVTILSLYGIDLTKLSIIPRQIVSILISMIFPIILIINYRKSLKKDIKNIKVNFRKYIEISILAYAIGIVLMVISNVIIQMGFNQEVAGNEQGIRDLINTLPIYMTISSCIIGPFEEEMIFRKIFKDVINNKALFIIISSLVFGSLHVIGNINNPLETLYVIPYGILGGTFAYIYVKTDNVLIPIIVHILHNSVLVAIQLLMVI